MYVLDPYRSCQIRYKFMFLVTKRVSITDICGSQPRATKIKPQALQGISLFDQQRHISRTIPALWVTQWECYDSEVSQDAIDVTNPSGKSCTITNYCLVNGLFPKVTRVSCSTPNEPCISALRRALRHTP